MPVENILAERSDTEPATSASASRPKAARSSRGMALAKQPPLAPVDGSGSTASEKEHQQCRY